MNDITIILFLVSFGIFALRLKWQHNPSLNLMGMAVPLFAIGMMFADTSITGNKIWFTVMPMVIIIIFSIVGFITDGKE